MIDYIIITIIAAAAGLAAWYIIRQKKSGAKCIGCPHAGKCGAGCNGRCQDSHIS